MAEEQDLDRGCDAADAEMTPEYGPGLYTELSSWKSLQIRPRHQVLLVDTRLADSSYLPDESSEPWPVQALGFLQRLLDSGDVGSCVDRFDVGVVPRLLRLGVREPDAAIAVLAVLLGFVERLPEVASEILRNHLHTVWHLGKVGWPSEIAAEAAEKVEEECKRCSPECDDAMAADLWTEDQSWFAFGAQHYVVRFAAASCDVPLGGAPPPPVARVAVFGRHCEDCVFDHVGTNKLRTGGRLWCAEILLARHLLTEKAAFLQGRVLLELGCGLGLAGISALSGCDGVHCILTDVEPGVVEAAQASMQYAGPSAAQRGRAVALDLRDTGALRALAAANCVSVVIASDLVYGALTMQEVARAAVAALPSGGEAWLLLPVHFRIGMDRHGFAEALVEAGAQVRGATDLSHGGVHDTLSACEEGQEYVLYEAWVPALSAGGVVPPCDDDMWT